MQWLHPSFPEGSIIVQDKQQSPHPTRCGEVWDAGINFCKDDGFLKKKKKKYLILADTKLFLLHRPLAGHNIKAENPVCSLGFL